MPNQEEREVVSTQTSPAYRAALEAEKPELMAMPEHEIERKVTLDPSAAAITGESAAKKVLPYRLELVVQLGDSAGAIVDALPTLVRATRRPISRWATKPNAGP